MGKIKNFSLKSHNFLLSKYFFCIAITLVLLFVIVGQFVFPDERDSQKSTCREYEGQWHHVLDNGVKETIDVPGKVEAEHGENVVFETTLPDKINSGEQMCFWAVWQDVVIYVDGELRVEYSTEDTRPFGENSTSRYVFCPLSESDAGKVLTYEFSSSTKYAGNVKAVYIGDKADIWTFLVKETISKAFIAIFLFILSVLAIISCIVLKFVYKKMMPVYYLAWTLFCCAFWIMSEFHFRQLIIKNISVLSSGTYWSLMLIPPFLTIYINEVQKGYYEKVYRPIMAYLMLLFAATSILQIFDIAQFADILIYTHLGIVLAVVTILVTIAIDTVKKRVSEYRIVAIGIYGLLVSAVIELITYYSGLRMSLGAILSVGLIFLFIMAIISTGQELFKSERKKQQAIMAKDAQAKFIANMSHEIRTPINAVIGMNEMILRESTNPVIVEYSQNIESASNMLLGLVNDVLDFSKIESGQMELVEDTYDIVMLLKDERLLLESRISDKKITPKLEIDTELPTKFWGDEFRIKQIMTNLISNAVKYTKEGTVTLKLSFEWLDADNVILKCSVTDTWIGIKEEDVPKLFDSFKRLDLKKNRNIEGTGLGLNIVKQLVTLMNGEVSVESEFGKGSTFSFAIPQKVMDKQPVGEFDKIVRKCKRSEKAEEQRLLAPDAKVLVIDDNSVNLAVVKGLLKRTKIKVDLAKSGKQGLELTRQNKYNVILLDHLMPELDGIETLELLKAEKDNPNKDTVVIALTANAVANAREMYKEYGFNDYFSKPIQADKLEEMLLEYLPDELIVKEDDN